SWGNLRRSRGILRVAPKPPARSLRSRTSPTRLEGRSRAGVVRVHLRLAVRVAHPRVALRHPRQESSEGRKVARLGAVLVHSALVSGLLLLHQERDDRLDRVVVVRSPNRVTGLAGLLSRLLVLLGGVVGTVSLHGSGQQGAPTHLSSALSGTVFAYGLQVTDPTGTSSPLPRCACRSGTCAPRSASSLPCSTPQRR